MSEKDNWMKNLPNYIKVSKNLDTDYVGYEFFDDKGKLNLSIPNKVCDMFSSIPLPRTVTLNLGDEKKQYVMKINPEASGSFYSNGNSMERRISWTYKLA